MMPSQRSKTNHPQNDFHNGFHRSSHYFRSAQPDYNKAENASITEDRKKSSKKKIINVFEFEPVGFMSHCRW